MQLAPGDAHVRAALGNLLCRVIQHQAPEAVVLPDEVDAFHCCISSQHVHERGQPHVDVRVKAKVPEAAVLVGERRVVGGVVQEDGRLLRLAAVVALDGLHQRRGNGRRVALHDDARAAVDGCAQQRQCLPGVARAVIAHHFQRTRAARKRHATARIHALSGHEHIAPHRFARVGKGAAERFNERQADGPCCCRLLRPCGHHRAQRPCWKRGQNGATTARVNGHRAD